MKLSNLMLTLWKIFRVYGGDFRIHGCFAATTPSAKIGPKLLYEIS
jgi:hypothetical protein